MDGNKDAKVRKHFNIIDLLLILAVIAIITGVALRYNLAGKIGLKSNKDTVIVSFLVQDIKPASAAAMINGDVFYIDQNDVELGELLSTTITDAEAYVENSNGELVLTYSTINCDVRGEFKATGSLTDDGFMLGGTQFISANKEVYVKSKHIMYTIRITGIRVSE